MLPRPKKRGTFFFNGDCSLRICAFSDTHGYHRKINPPDGDVLICAGDITGNGQLTVMEDFANWMKQFPHKKIVIMGNHDRYETHNSIRDTAIQYLLDVGITYLEHSEIVIDGLKIFGSPYTPRFYDWSFNVDRGNAIAAKWNLIPNDVNVLVSHGPPYGILDQVPKGVWFGEEILENAGCVDLLNRVKELKQLKAHLFGHIHYGSGVKIINDVVFANCAILDEQYQVANPVRVIDV